MSGKKLLILTIVIIAIEAVILGVFGAFGPDAEKTGEVLTQVGLLKFIKYEFGLANFQDVSKIQLFGDNPFWSVNKASFIMMMIVDIFLVTMAFLATRKLTAVPSRLQSVFELLVDMFKDITTQSLGENGMRHLPMLGSLFMFLWISNCIGTVPFTVEPSRDLNVTVGHMLVVIFVVHFEAIRVKGLGTYIKGYFEPFPIMAPLNFISEISSGVSLAFRLFGNILGGAIIVMVISYLFKYTIVMVGLNLFFSLFVGTIQAFVFTMLSMTYIAVAIAD